MKVIWDLETMSMTDGFKPGELMFFTAGRQTGKSMLNQWYGSTLTSAQFSITAKAEVDGDIWYTVICSREVSEWLRSQSRELQYEALAHGFHFPQFNIHEKLYTLLALKWS
jgi:hypothetical protein